MNQEFILYFKTPKDGEPAGMIQMDNLVVTKANEDKEKDLKKTFCFVVTPAGESELKANKVNSGTVSKGHHESFVFSAESEPDRGSWVQSINVALERNEFYNALRDLVPESMRKRGVVIPTNN